MAAIPRIRKSETHPERAGVECGPVAGFFARGRRCCGRLLCSERRWLWGGCEECLLLGAGLVGLGTVGLGLHGFFCVGALGASRTVLRDVAMAWLARRCERDEWRQSV